MDTHDYSALTEFTGLKTATFRLWQTTRPDYLAFMQQGLILVDLLDMETLEQLLSVRSYSEMEALLGTPCGYYQQVGLKRSTAMDWGKTPARTAQLCLMLLGGMATELSHYIDPVTQIKPLSRKSGLDLLDLAFLLFHRPEALSRLLHKLG